MTLTQNEKSKLKFITNFVATKVDFEKAARFFSGFKSGKSFLSVLDRMECEDVEPLEMPKLPGEKGEDKQTQRPEQKSDDRTLPLPELKI